MHKLIVLLAYLATSAVVFAEDAGKEVSFDGLERIEDARVGVAYIDPEADFSVFRRVAILDPHVAFRANWQRDQNRNRSRRIRSSDMERIKADVAYLFRDVFAERLEAAGFEIVNVANEDVLILRPAIIDLDITAPDAPRAGRSRTFAASTGAATLYLQLVDSLSGAAIGRAIDRQGVRRSGGTVGWTNRVTNRSDARRVVGGWADTLVNFLNSHYYTPGDNEAAAAEPADD